VCRPPKRIVVAILPKRLAKVPNNSINTIDLIISMIAPRDAAPRERKTWTPLRPPTDKLGACGAARYKRAPKAEHRQHKGLINRAENSHVPSEGESGSCRDFDHGLNYSDSLQPSPPSDTISSRLALNVPSSQPIYFA
jgi:hypothetical protein